MNQVSTVKQLLQNQENFIQHVRKTNPVEYSHYDLVWRYLVNSGELKKPNPEGNGSGRILHNMIKKWEESFFKYFNKNGEFIYEGKTYECRLKPYKEVKSFGYNNHSKVLERDTTCLINGRNYTIGKIITTRDEARWNGSKYSSIFEFNENFLQKQIEIEDKKELEVQHKLDEWCCIMYSTNPHLFNIPREIINEKRIQIRNQL